MISCKIIADSISKEGKRITTMQLMYPRFIHSEMLTHRVFSRNASSSRAIPVKKMLEMVRNDLAMPIHWGKNQPGMQASEEIQHVFAAKDLWIAAARNACDIAEEMSNLGLHKQVVNRILEPFQHISVVLTATEFDNWFELRAHPDAQPEIQELAKQMQSAMLASFPKTLHANEWHLPYVGTEDIAAIKLYIENNRAPDKMIPVDGYEEIYDLARKVSAARCCRVSYLKHDGTSSSIEEDLALCDRLAGSRPIHASPFEHQATPDTFVERQGYYNKRLHGNFVGWVQYRKLIENSFK